MRLNLNFFLLSFTRVWNAFDILNRFFWNLMTQWKYWWGFRFFCFLWGIFSSSFQKVQKKSGWVLWSYLPDRFSYFGDQKVRSSWAECCFLGIAFLSSFRGACYLPASISNTSYFSSKVSRFTWYITGTRFSEMSIVFSFPHFLFVFLMVLYLQNLPW